ncbi:MAG TPA: GNAT family N-acetyltransferase [Verrucomicrobiae bacterium]|nr:GNAT family N-acetyltransferase [Verrucomicrobiae bacterium]
MSLSHAAIRPHITRLIHTEKGPIHIEGPTLPEKVKGLGIDDGLKAFRPAWRQKEALEEISELEDGWVVTAEQDGILIGYITFHPPCEYERWGRAGLKEILELGAIEVAPGFRHYKLGRNMMEVAFADPVMDDFIVISTEYYWHWDLDGTGLNVWEYQLVMKKLMEAVGLVKRDTDEQEIRAHPANMLMARMGANVKPEVAAAFDRLLFRKKPPEGE